MVGIDLAADFFKKECRISRGFPACRQAGKNLKSSFPLRLRPRLFHIFLRKHGYQKYICIGKFNELSYDLLGKKF